MAGGRLGRNNAAYRAAAAIYRQGQHLCHLCGDRPGTTVDHDPPLSTFPHPNLWHGTLKPACPTCQSRQGNRITREKRNGRVVSRNW